MRPWHFLRTMFRNQPWLILATGLTAGGAFYLIPLLPGLIVRQLLDHLTDEAPASFGTTTLLAMLVGVGAGQFTLLMAAIVAENGLLQWSAALLRKNMLRRVLERPGARALPSSSGEAISRFRNDADQGSHFLAWTLDPLGQIVVLVVALSFLFRVDARLTLGVFIPLIAVVTISRLAGNRLERYSRANQESIGAVTGMIGEMFGAVTAIKVAGAEQRVVNHFRTINDARRKATLTHLIFDQLLNSLSTNMANIGTGIILMLAAQSIRDGSLSVGDLALFISYVSWLSTVVSMTGYYLNQYRTAAVSIRRMSDLMQGTPERLVERGAIYVRGPLPSLPPLPTIGAERLDTLAVQNLTVTYPGTDRGVHEINLALPRGSMTVVVGEIGSGKTTLLRGILGLLPSDQGEIHWNGQPVFEPGTFFVPPRTSYTPQVPRLFSESLRANILMGLSEDDVDLPAAIRSAVMEQDLANLEDGLDTLVGTRGVKLSGGQLQRAATARMFVRPAELYVFDDLSSALDVETERELWDRLFERGDEITTLVVSHRHTALNRADQIVMLEGGRITAQGSLPELLATSPAMQRIWHGEAGQEGTR